MQKSGDSHSFPAQSILVFSRKARLLRVVVREFQRPVEQMIQIDFFADGLQRCCRLAWLQKIPPAEFPEARPDDNHAADHPRRNRFGSSARPGAETLGLPREEGALCAREQIWSAQERNGNRRFLAWRGIHGLRRTLFEFFGRCGSWRRRQRSRARFQRGIRPRNEYCTLSDCRRGPRATL